MKQNTAVIWSVTLGAAPGVILAMGGRPCEENGFGDFILLTARTTKQRNRRPNSRLGFTHCGSSAEYAQDEIEVADRLARHPNTPARLLIFFADARPAAFCENPTAPMLPLEMPDVGRRFGREALPRLLREPSVPAAIVQAIAADATNLRDRAEAKLHIAYAGEVADATEWGEVIKVALVTERDLCPDLMKPEGQEIFRTLAHAGCVPNYLLAESEEKDAPPQVWCEEADPAALERALRLPRNGSISPDLCRCLALAHITNDPDYEESRGYSQLNSHARSSKWLERLGVALSPASVTRKEMLIALVEDGNRLVRAASRARLQGEEVTL